MHTKPATMKQHFLQGVRIGVIFVLGSCYFWSVCILIESEQEERLSTLHFKVNFREIPEEDDYYIQGVRTSDDDSESDYDYDSASEVNDPTSLEEGYDGEYTDEFQTSLSTAQYEDGDDEEPENYTRVVIGIVSCRNGTSSNYLEQTTLLLKSVLISAELYNVTRVDFHLFLENFEDERFLLEKLELMGYPSGYEQVDMNLIVHSAINTVPLRYRRQMVFQKRYRCGYTRFFFPSALPRVDSIIYLNVDMLLTGNILDFWNYFKEMRGEPQMIGATKNLSPESRSNQHLDIERNIGTGDTPQPSPKGMNSGMLLMNLTRMRQYSWEEKFLRAYQDYSKIAKGGSITGQKVMNILLFYNPALHFVLPCHYNFASGHCGNNGEHSCLRGAEDDSHGVQLIHVNGPYNFNNAKSGNPFQPLLRYYHQFNMTKEKGADSMAKELMIPIRTAYDRKSKGSKCYGKLNKLLFKNFFGF